MKEAAISAGALLGLLAFAGIYNNSGSHRARRNVLIEEEEEIVDRTGEFMNDIGNMTEGDWKEMQFGLGITEAELLPFEIDEEDIEAKQRRKKGGKGGKVNMNRFKLKDVPRLHDKMVETWNFRQNTLMANFVNDGGIAAGSRQPADQLEEEAAAAAHVVNGAYPDYSGNDKTAPSVQKFLNEFGYADDGANLFREGNAQVWFLLPAAVPLFTSDSADHLGKYGNYWEFVSSFSDAFDKSRGRGGNTVRISVGLYHKGAVYSPRGTQYRAGRFPWARIKNFYLRPRTTTQMPYIIPTAESLLAWIPRFGSSSASAGDDCYTFWFHQDFAADANQLLLEDQFARVDQLYQACTVMHIFVGMDRNDPKIQGYAAALQPNLQTKLAKDPDFSGVFFANSLDDVSGTALREQVFKYMTIIKSRAGCRVVEDAYTAPVSDASGTAFAGTAAAGTMMPAAEGVTMAPGGGFEVVEVTDSSFEATEAATVRGLMDMDPTEAPKIPEIDSCCGHDMFNGTPYDSELRTCCDDGSAQAFSADGSDPCVGDLGFDFKK